MTSEEPNNTGGTSSLTTTTTITKTTNHKTQRGFISESSTISDNTSDFIEIVKKYEVVYNNHHPDYKNVEVKAKIWSQIAEEIGLSVDASKRKWKNLRDSYTKYLRSYRVGTKTAKKYQFWAHAEHMEFLKPFQGPGRSSINNNNLKEDDDNECDLGYQVLAKASANNNEEEVKTNTALNTAAAAAAAISLPISSTVLTNMIPNFVNAGGSINTTPNSMSLSIPTPGGITGSATAPPSTIMLPVPSLPTVQLPPSLTAKPIMGDIASSVAFSLASASSSSASANPLASSSNTYTTPSSFNSLTSSSLASQVFTLPQLSAKGPILMPSSNTASSVGCLIIEPQLFASADTFKKEFGSGSSTTTSSNNAQITPSGLQIYPTLNGNTAATSQAVNNRLNPPLITKIRRVQPSPQASAINLSISTTPATVQSTNSTLLSSYKANGGFNTNSTNILPTLGGSTTITATSSCNSNGLGNTAVAPPPFKKPKTSAEVDIAAILQANRDLDANTLFFLSLARSVRNMPTKFQNLAKMRCMRIVSDIEMELDNIDDDGGPNGSTKYCTNNSDSPPPPLGNSLNEAQSEHFVYVMSPSRVERRLRA
ncbi:hypothetical protein DOY81_012341 [Sarcophaga bullata]|nr:hypothetical protein DOY81_012341 [Sarcophaga bullata]